MHNGIHIHGLKQDWICILNKIELKVELEEIEKTQKCQFRYQIIILETWTLYLILSTWLTKDILLIKKVDLLGKNQS